MGEGEECNVGDIEARSPTVALCSVTEAPHLRLFRAEQCVGGAGDRGGADLGVAALQEVEEEEVEGGGEGGHLEQLARGVHGVDVVAEVGEGGEPPGVAALQHQRRCRPHSMRGKAAQSA
jgi:hypothetical protein